VKINIESLMDGNIGVKEDYKFSYSNQQDDFIVNCSASIMRTDTGVNVRSDCLSTLKHSCSRCLQSMENKISFEFDESFVDQKHIAYDSTWDEKADDVFIIDDTNSIDMSIPLNQYMLTERPMAPLCDIECKGLCNQCGTNFNNSLCSCKPKLSNPSWEKLRDLWDEKRK
jgi:uncharacterized protein